jgi:hypothetical protein
VEILFGILRVLFRSCFTLFDAALASDADFGATLPLHLLQAVATRAYEQTEEVDLRKFLNGNVNLLRRTLRAFLLVILDWGTEVRIVFKGALNKPNTLILQLLTIADFAGVGPAAMSVVCRRRRRRTNIATLLVRISR